MSYILFKAGSSISTPVSIANGGTGADTKAQAVINLTSPAFNNSAQSSDWGAIYIPESLAPDPSENMIAINTLLQTLQVLGVLA